MESDGATRRDFWISSASIIGTMSIEESQSGETRCFYLTLPRFYIDSENILKVNLLIIYDRIYNFEYLDTYSMRIRENFQYLKEMCSREVNQKRGVLDKR